MQSAITWFEIPTQDLDRASDFYAQVMDRKLRRENMGGTEMAVFPYDQGSGIGGCLVKTSALKPGSGSIVYLSVSHDIDAAIGRAIKMGGTVALEKTALPGNLGHYAHIIDCEGNRVGLHAASA